MTARALPPPSARLPLRGAGRLLAGAVALAAVAAVAGGLVRAGVALPVAPGAAWWPQAVLEHAP